MDNIRYPSYKIQRYKNRIDNFDGGSNTLVNQARLDTKYAVEINNMYQVQDKIWKTRPGTGYYGEEITGATSIDGAHPYLKTDNTLELLAIADGKAWKSTDGGAWTEVTGATFTAGVTPYFLQINNRLYITSGTDDLCYYNGSTLQNYAPLSDPSTPTSPSRTTLTSGTYNNYYRVVAVNDVGYTNPSASLNITTNKHRDSWATNESVGFTLPTVTSATGYQIFWGEFDGEEQFLGVVVAGTTSFTDDGSLQPNPYVETPDDNTTGAPKFRSMEVSGNRIWATYDPDNPYRVYFSGTGQYLGYFSPFYGGGYIDLEKGGMSKPISVVHYRDGKGNPMITALCSSHEGRGTIFQIELTTSTIGETSFTVPAAYKIVGSIGTDASHSVVKVGDNVFFANKRGVYALRNKEQIFNVLSSDDLTAPIRNKWEGLNPAQMTSVCAYFLPPRVYFAVAEGSSNDKVAIFDFERNNWNWSWSLPVKQFLEYTESGGSTYFLGVPVTGNKLVRISENDKGDLGVSFYQSYVSPLIPVSDDYTTTARVKEAVFELGNFRGTATCEVLGMQKNKQITSIGSKEKQASSGNTGVSDDLVSDFFPSDTNDTPSVFTESSTKVKVRVNKKLYAIQYKVSANALESNYEILGVQAKGTLSPGRSPSSW